MNTERTQATLIATTLLGVMSSAEEIFGRSATEIALLALTHLTIQDAHDTGHLKELLRRQGVAEEIANKVQREMKEKERT